MSKIKSLLKEYSGSRIYVYLADEATGQKFLHDAEVEGFTFSDGIKPTQRHSSDIFALNENMTINYVGFVGHMAFRCADKLGDRPLVKLDYKEFLKK